MPALWLLLVTANSVAARAQAPKPNQISLPGAVTITYQSTTYDMQTQKGSFDEGVTVQYDVTTITADHVYVDQNLKHATATGHVHLADPLATMDADSVELWWAPTSRRGYAENAHIVIGSSQIRARSVEIGPGLWVLYDADGTTSRAKPPWYSVHSRKVIIRPGQDGLIEKPQLSILGKPIVTLPNRGFNLDQRSEGLTIPGFNYQQDQGLGLSWGGGFLIDHSTDLAFALNAVPTERPSFGLSIARSLLPDAKPTNLITPASELGQRFFWGYLDDIAVTTPSNEEHYIRSPRQSDEVDSVWNQTVPDRGINVGYSKALEGVYEQGGTDGAFGYMTQFRVQSIRELGDPFVDRLVFVGDLSPPVIHLAPNLRTLLRADTNVFLGSNNYGWVRGVAGLAYQPIKQLTISGGSYFSTDAGSPTYDIDPLAEKNGFIARADLNLGPTKLSYLVKYDDIMKWYDREYTVSQVVGCFEPFLLYRENPSDYVLGLRLRLDDLTDLITKRNFTRPATPEHVISPDLNAPP